uniref:Putative secreted protein n=1 Tax=Anopheles darlingi TaxID=43151 RepID=A0A2M4DG28_ANODA
MVFWAVRRFATYWSVLVLIVCTTSSSDWKPSDFSTLWRVSSNATWILPPTSSTVSKKDFSGAAGASRRTRAKVP